MGFRRFCEAKPGVVWEQDDVDAWFDANADLFDYFGDHDVEVRVVGSVASQGRSDNDLDVLITPSSQMGNMEIIQALTGYFSGRARPFTMNNVGLTYPDGRQVDFFIGKYIEPAKRKKKA